MQRELEAAYELKTQRVANREGCKLEGKVLNRIARWTREGYELEGDPRHAELVIEQLELNNVSALSSPGVDTAEPEVGDAEDEELDAAAATLYRGIVARCNYMSVDRPELQFAVKEACREMSKPTASSWRKLVHIGRYLKGHPRLVWRFALQLLPTALDIYVDSNWAGCRRTRKSTSGGVIMLGSHILKTWSKTQAVIAKSSGEAELFGVVRGSTEGLGVITLGADMGMTLGARVHVDANAAKGIVEREGLGKVRHVEVDVLWLQEQQARARLPLVKIDGTRNPADLMTKNLSRAEIMKNIEILGLIESEGRSAKAAQLHSVANCIDDVVGRDSDGCDGDTWTSRGEGGNWIRNHATPRLAMFTPFRVPRGPAKNQRLAMRRRTIGTFLSGGDFDVIDDWTTGSQAHRFLRDAWTGRTEFTIATTTTPSIATTTTPSIAAPV